MKWQYKEEWFKSIPFNWQRAYDAKCPLDVFLLPWNPVLIPRNYNPENKDILIYVPKHDKCYTIQRFGIMGNGNKLKMCLEDIYTKMDIYVMAKNVELVVKIIES